MSTVPPEKISSMLACEQRPAQKARTLADKWVELQGQSAELAKLAELSVQQAADERAAFLSMMGSASASQRNLVQQGIEDIDAMMQPGLVALRTIRTRGQDATAPAIALWREFHAARDAIIHVLTDRAASEALDAA